MSTVTSKERLIIPSPSGRLDPIPGFIRSAVDPGQLVVRCGVLLITALKQVES